MQHRHNRVMHLTGPVLPALRQEWGLFHARLPEGACLPLFDASGAEHLSPAGECIFCTIRERKILKSGYVWQTKDSNPSI